VNAKQPRTPCKNCGNEPERPEYVYCSNQCQRHYELKNWIVDWQQGATNFSSKTVKRILIQLFGEKCSKCGWAKRHPVTGTVPVEIEHKDGNYRNNHKDNVCLLCPNCHSLTTTFRALNWGNGREARRKASVAQLVQQVTCNHPFTCSTQVAGSKSYTPVNQADGFAEEL